MRILLVEDDDYDAMQVRRVVKHTSLAESAIERAKDLAEARALVSTSAFDVVLLDLNLPDASGLEAVRAMSKYRRPIVVLTGQGDADLASRGVREGAQDFLEKGSMQAVDLARSIRYAVDRHALAERATRAAERERLLRNLIEKLVDATKAGEVVERAVTLLPDLPGIDSATFYLRRGNGSYKGLDHTGHVRTVADEHGHVFDLVLAGDEPVAPGLGPGALRNNWLVPVHGEEVQLGVLAAHASTVSKDVAMEGMLATIARVLMLAVRRARRADELRRSAAAAQKIAAYLPKEVLRTIGDNPDADILPGGRRAEALVMFVDLSGFSTIAEQVAPERVVRLLNEYFAQMHTIVLRHGGVIDKHIGDAALLVFQSKEGEYDKDVARRACRAGAELLENFGPRAARTVHIGAAYGDVVIGNVGSAHRYEHTVIGDTVNLAARLQELAPPGCIAVDETIERALRGASRSGKQKLMVQTRRTTKIRGRRAEIRVTIFQHRDHKPLAGD